MFQIISYGASDVGLERKNNEDAFCIDAQNGLYVVCDGMGGHASGEIASRVTVEAMQQFVGETMHSDDFRWPFDQSAGCDAFECRALDAAVRLANRDVYETAKGDARHKGMGTTVVALLAGANRIGVVHVGDSRIYRLRGDALSQITEDHSLLNHYRRTRPMSEDEIRNFKGKNVIVRAVGLRESVEPEVQVVDYVADDTYLLCTDGLTDLVADTLIAETIRGAGGDLKAAAMRLIQFALDAGGKDNVTILLARLAETADNPTEDLPILDGEMAGLAGSADDADDADDGEDTSPGFDIGVDGSWDIETLPEYDVRQLRASAGAGHAHLGGAGAPELDDVHIQGPLQPAGVRSRGSKDASGAPASAFDETPPDGIVAVRERTRSEEAAASGAADPRRDAPDAESPFAPGTPDSASGAADSADDIFDLPTLPIKVGDVGEAAPASVSLKATHAEPWRKRANDVAGLPTAEQAPTPPSGLKKPRFVVTATGAETNSDSMLDSATPAAGSQKFFGDAI